ncbi:MAG TPA: AAA family ATPase [Bacillota bacterium]|nr:AAA family ATPase [Bacillota bacterium]
MVALQGGMAVGKTTLAKKLQERFNDVQVSFENPSHTIRKIKELGLDKFHETDYYEIQRLFIQAEIERYQSLQIHPKVIIDLGPEEIEFYTLSYPQSIGKQWDVEFNLSKELAALRSCRLDGILFLDASAEVLKKRKEHDGTRNRGFFEHYLTKLHPLKKVWFERDARTAMVNVDRSNIEETVNFAVQWLERIETNQAGN